MPRLFSGHIRSLSGSQSPPKVASETPDLNPGTDAFTAFGDVGAPPQLSGPRPRNTPKTTVTLPSANENTQREMIPVLSLLTAHSARIYEEGYFMLLNDINNDGKPVHNRQWMEVFASLTGPTLACWDAISLDQGQDPKPIYLNITDATFQSVASLPTGKGGLERIIVVSTTMKNRYLLQFATDKSFQQWTAALRLSQFEHTALQEAYTGALLSARGSQLNGARALLGGTKTVREDWCNVRFGGGMPWNRCYYILTPPNLVKDKKQKKAGLGEISFYESPKTVKKGPLATVVAAFSAYAVFPERSVLVDVSNLIKCHGMARFAKDKEARESQIFIMPEQHPGIKGFETLIRFIIPFLDVFQLYGRPKRLNADKKDVRSLLFAMPTLPKAYYLDVVDVGMLTSLAESHNWGPNDWTNKIKELLARKLASGYKGLGSIHDIVAKSQGQNSNTAGGESSSEKSDFSSQKSSATSGKSSEKSNILVAKRDAPKAPGRSNLSPPENVGMRERDARALSQPRPVPEHMFIPPQSINSHQQHERSASEGQDRNDLLQPAPYTPPTNGSTSSFNSHYSGSGFATPNGSSTSFRNGGSPMQASPMRPPQINTRPGVQPNLNGQGSTPQSESSSIYTGTPTAERVYGNGPPAAHSSGGLSSGGPGAIETKPGHYSYAEYSEYMRTYLANGIDTREQAGGNSPPRGPRPQPGREPINQDRPAVPPQPMMSGGSKDNAPGGQFASGGPKRAPGGPYAAKTVAQPSRIQQQAPVLDPYNNAPGYTQRRDPQAQYGYVPQAKQAPYPQQQQQQQRNPYQGNAYPQQPRSQGSPGPAAQGLTAPGNSYALGPRHSPKQQQQQRLVHHDVRTAPPMRPVQQQHQHQQQSRKPNGNSSSPYNIASQQGSYPTFPTNGKSSPRGRVQGGRPMP